MCMVLICWELSCYYNKIWLIPSICFANLKRFLYNDQQETLFFLEFLLLLPLYVFSMVIAMFVSVRSPVHELLAHTWVSDTLCHGRKVWNNHTCRSRHERQCARVLVKVILVFLVKCSCTEKCSQLRGGIQDNHMWIKSNGGLKAAFSEEYQLLTWTRN
jgi:hypothetical protein